MTDPILSKKCKGFSCKNCDFYTSNKYNYKKHLSTDKHRRLTFTDSKNAENAILKEFICDCGKNYKHKQSLYTHKKICKFKEKNNENLENQLIKTDGEVDYKSMFIKMIDENNKLVKTISELVPKVGNNNTVNNKQKFNINIFLNEQCKDALTMNEFIDQIKINLDNLLVTKNKGLSEGVSNIFIENMNKLSLYERPMHCTDPKREVVYIKNDEWEKDEENKKLKAAIKKVECTQQKNLDTWTNEHPNWMENSEEQEEYFTLIKNSTESLSNKEEKVIKKLCNQVYINENNSKS